MHTAMKFVVLVVLLALRGCAAQSHVFGRRLSQAPTPAPQDSTQNVTVPPENLAVASSPGADAPVCPFEIQALYSGAPYMNITTNDLSECCDRCKGDPKCNVYVYCSKEAGCAQGSDITPYRLCVMKYQVNLNAFSYPPAISRSNITNFTSGSFPTASARAPAPEIAFPPGTLGNPDLIPASIAEAPTVRERNAVNEPTCAFEDRANYKGDDYRPVNFTFAASLSRCCAFCKASGGCNMYVYCGRKEGCLHDGVTEPYQQCVLKYNSNITTYDYAPAYSRGDDTNFTSGVSSFDLFLPPISPPPAPAPPSSYQLSADNGGVFVIQPGSNYIGTLLRNTSEDSVVACGTTCENTAGCNVFNFCPMMPGCSDGGNNTYPTGHCDLRSQAGLQRGKRPAQYTANAEFSRVIELSSGTYFAGQSSSSSRTGAIVGGVVGGVAFLALLAGLAWLVARRRLSVKAGQRTSFWKSLRDTESSDPSPSNFKLMHSQDDMLDPRQVVELARLPTAEGEFELSRLPTTDCAVAPLNYPGAESQLLKVERPAQFLSRRSRADRRILTARTADHSIVPVFEGEQEEGMRIIESSTLQDLWKIDPRNIAFVERGGKPVKLGEGGHGVVSLGTLFGNTPVAVKTTERPNQKEQDAFAREIIFLKACRHPNLIQFIGASEREDQTLLIMEYMPGDLYHHIKKNAKSRSPHLRWYNRGRSIALDICCGLTYLHSHGILHLDIKSPNILLSENWTAKISDLGLGRTVTQDKDSADSIGASRYWASPEQLLGSPCTAKSDVYSLGTVIWELCTGETIKDRYLRPLQVPEEAPLEIQDLICACRANSAPDRPSAAEVHAAITSSAARLAP